jgi:hypothetical protein
MGMKNLNSDFHYKEKQIISIELITFSNEILILEMLKNY